MFLNSLEMSYKDVYYFVAMCLTISLEKKNKQIDGRVRCVKEREAHRA